MPFSSSALNGIILLVLREVGGKLKILCWGYGQLKPQDGHGTQQPECSVPICGRLGTWQWLGQPEAMRLAHCGPNITGLSH